MLDTARPHLDSALSTAHSLVEAVRSSDHPAAKALVDLAANPRLHAFYDSTTDLLLRNLPLVVSLVGLALHLFISDLARKRSERNYQRLANQRYEMGDYGLGTPSQAAAGGGAGQSRRSRDDHGVVEVQWGREKLRVPLPPPNSPLSTLRATLYNQTGVPPSHQKLIYAGAVLKDDLLPLSAYGLVDDDESVASDGAEEGAKKSFWDSWALMGRGGAKKKVKKLVMLGSKDVSARVDDRLSQRKDLADLAAQSSSSAGEGVSGGAEEKKVDSEEAVQRRIREISTQKLDELEPQVKQVESWLAQEQTRRASFPSISAEDPDAPAPPRRTLLYLSEVLLQGLLKLDSIEIPSGYAEARRERKEAVRRVQEVLDRVDSAKEGWKKLGLSLA
ncbi:hypothetical protein RTBOTA2_003633 [Rhodotorula toruloides]|nr:hypothetical protein RTBOTA2_003633 [Rhodotorula toruloides]